MKEFDKLLETIDSLLAPDGCPWDREQTLLSMRKNVLEEVYELIEAINNEDNPHICEELGDLFLNSIFLSRLAEKEKRFLLKEVLSQINEKLIRRHPHVFGNEKASNSDEVLVHWEAAKHKEKNRENPFEGIPKSLPALARTQKTLKKLKKKPQLTDDLGSQFIKLIIEAQEQGLDAEQELQKKCQELQQNIEI